MGYLRGTFGDRGDLGKTVTGLKLLVVEDDCDQAELIMTDLLRFGCEPRWVDNMDAAEQELKRGNYDLLLSDINLFTPGDGIKLCTETLQKHPNMSVVLMTAYGDVDVAVAALRAGAHDLVTKPFSGEELMHRLERSVEICQLRRTVARLQREQSLSENGIMIGKSPAFMDVQRLIHRLSNVETSVLITGESGTGKELVAKSIHSQSRRKEGPFVPANCAALPHDLLESELFGHTRGAFTGAMADYQGLFRMADGGTLFLDEIGDMPLDMQAKLLRVLQEGQVRPLGGNVEISFDTRIIAATNRDLRQEVKAQRFREDLYYRIHVVQVSLPPLRKREDDVLVLAQKFIQRAATTNNLEVRGMTQEVAEMLLSYDWPGNVRELEHAMERAVVLAEYELITVSDLPEAVRGTSKVTTVRMPQGLSTLQEAENSHLQYVLSACGGNKAQTARVLGIDRRSLYRKLEKLSPRA